MTVKSRAIANAEKFRAWIMATGVGTISEQLTSMGPRTAASPQAIYQWLNGSVEPRASKIRALVQIANGAITYAQAHDFIELAGEAYAAGKTTTKGIKP